MFDLFVRKGGDEKLPYYWGVDSAVKVTKEIYDCVLKNFGKPRYWGRYLARKLGKVDGLSLEEVELLHNSGTKVLPIYSNFSSAEGYRNGTVIAQNMIFHARRLKIPNGKILIANIEHYFPVDKDWIQGFVDSMYQSGYKGGFYHDPVKGVFHQAYCEAVQEDEKVAIQTVLWSAEPEIGVTKARQAPNFNPRKVSCKGNTWGWQYGRDSDVCPIDTNLINQSFFDLLW